MQLVYLNDMQEPDALSLEAGEFKDITSLTESVVHIPVGAPERVKVVWAYCYYRVPVSAVAMPPECLGRDHPKYPPPAIANVSPINATMADGTTKQVGVEFDVTASTEESWQCNVQVECTYYEQLMGRTYTHRRTASFTLSSQKPIDQLLAEIA